MKKLALLLVTVLVLSILPAQAADIKESAYDRVMRTGTLKVGYTPWPPYQMRDPNTGEISGLSYDYMQIIASLLGLKLEWVQLTGLGTQVEGLKQGMYDVVVNDGPYVFSMIKFIDFSDPLFYAPVHAYVRANDVRFKSITELNTDKVKFVGLDGDLSTDLVTRIYPKAKLDTLPASTDPGMMMTNVNTEKGDAVIIDVASVEGFNKNNKPGLKAINMATPIAVYPIGFSSMKDDGKLLTMMNGVIAALHDTNQMEPLFQKWLPGKGMYFPVAKPYAVK